IYKAISLCIFYFSKTLPVILSVGLAFTLTGCGEKYSAKQTLRNFLVSAAKGDIEAAGKNVGSGLNNYYAVAQAMHDSDTYDDQMVLSKPTSKLEYEVVGYKRISKENVSLTVKFKNIDIQPAYTDAIARVKEYMAENGVDDSSGLRMAISSAIASV
ncbi:hypothetical protein, partial [Treponema sp. R6D11]